MAQIQLDSKRFAEGALDAVVTAGAFVLASRFFMQPGVAVSDQPFSFLVALAIGIVAWKLSARWKVFK